MVYEEYADIALLNGKVVTVDQEDTIAEAVAVKDGKILKVGASKDVKMLVSTKTMIIDLKGKTVLPGLIDAHTHVEGMATNFTYMVQIHSPPLKSAEEILEKIKERAQETPKGEWIIGQGRFRQPCPTKEQIDKIVPDHPVALRLSAHVCQLNSKALQLVKITRDTPDPLDGIIYKDATTGEPTGRLRELYHILPIPPYTYEQKKQAIKKTLHDFLQLGVTTIYTMPSTDGIRIYQELLEDKELPLRIRMQIYPKAVNMDSARALDCLLKLGLRTGFGNEWLKFGGLKLYPGGALRYDPPGQRKTWSGTLRIPQEELTDLVTRAHKAGIQVWIHAVGDKAQDMAIEAIEVALKEMPRKDHRHRIEHAACALYDKERPKRIKKLESIPVPTTAWLANSPGYKEIEGVKSHPLRTFIDEGLMPPGSSDCVGAEPESINPMLGIYCAVTHKDHTGKVSSPEERITAMEAIRMWTINGAYSGFEERIKGSIEPGKLADLIVLSEDPLTVTPDKIKDIKVDTTIVNGRIAFSRK